MEVMFICVPIIVFLIFGWMALRQLRTKQEIKAKTIEPEVLNELLNSNQVKLYDVRQPLDFLAQPEIIPGAKRIPPKDIPEQTSSFSRDQDSVIYCTGGDNDTCKMVLGKARALKFKRVKILKGGLEAWKTKGFPVEPYTASFHLDTAT